MFLLFQLSPFKVEISRKISDCESSPKIHMIIKSFFNTLLLSTHYSKDAGHKWFLEDAFQNEYRLHPGGKWLPTTDSPWTDIVCFHFIHYFHL